MNKFDRLNINQDKWLPLAGGLMLGGWGRAFTVFIHISVTVPVVPTWNRIDVLSHNNYNLREKKRKCHQQSDASFAGKTRGSRTGRFNISQGRYEVEREREEKKEVWRSLVRQWYRRNNGFDNPPMKLRVQQSGWLSNVSNTVAGLV